MSGDRKFLVDARMKNPHSEGCLSNTRWVHESRFRVTEFTRDTHHRVCVESLRIHEHSNLISGQCAIREYIPLVEVVPSVLSKQFGADDSEKHNFSEYPHEYILIEWPIRVK